jgi:hypothetical protein
VNRASLASSAVSWSCHRRDSTFALGRGAPAGLEYLRISTTSPTLQLARQEATLRARAPAAAPTPTPAPAPTPTARSSGPARATTAAAIAISWVAAGELVLGLVWSAATMAPNVAAGTPPESLPYALGWSGISLAALASSVASMFCDPGRRRQGLVGIAVAAALGLLACVLIARAWS